MAAASMSIRMDRRVAADLRIFQVLSGTTTYSDTVRWLMNNLQPEWRQAFSAVELARAGGKKKR